MWIQPTSKSLYIGRPMTLPEVHNFSDLTKFYRSFMVALSYIVWPLTQVTEEKNKIFSGLNHNRRNLMS